MFLAFFLQITGQHGIRIGLTEMQKRETIKEEEKKKKENVFVHRKNAQVKGHKMWFRRRTCE